VMKVVESAPEPEVSGREWPRDFGVCGIVSSEKGMRHCVLGTVTRLGKARGSLS
jgi:hypothetical protein